MRKLWWLLLALLVGILALSWWVPALFVGLLPAESAFVIGLLGFWLLGHDVLADSLWALALLRGWHTGRISQDEAQARLGQRVNMASVTTWLALWQAWLAMLSPRRAWFYRLLAFTGLLTMVVHMAPPVPFATLQGLMQGFFLGAATVAFVVWVLEHALADMLEDLVFAAAASEAA